MWGFNAEFLEQSLGREPSVDLSQQQFGQITFTSFVFPWH